MTSTWETEGNELKEGLNTSEFGSQHPVIRVLAQVFSYVFHPLFVPVYLVMFLMMVPPFFSGFTASQKGINFLAFVIIYSFFPLVTVLLLKGVGFISSVYLHTQRDRIIPYIACGIFYFWRWYVVWNQPQWAPEVVQLSLGIFLASSFGLIANIYFKISMHAIAMGVALVFIGSLGLYQSFNYAVYMSVCLLIAGLVCTSRFIVSDHRPAEIYGGLFVGGLSQLIAIWANGFL